jgi:hypothetical protein
LAEHINPISASLWKNTPIYERNFMVWFVGRVGVRWLMHIKTKKNLSRIWGEQQDHKCGRSLSKRREIKAFE